VLELFYTWQLLQVKHIKPLPIIFLGNDFWGGLMEWMKSGPLKQGLMSESDFDKIKIFDTQEEVLAYLKPEITEFYSKSEG
jgi:predicted Rossmann-fold nucleotide-binding protein